MWLRDHSRSLKVVPFESVSVVSYSPSIVTMILSVAVCEISSVKEWCDLENRVMVRSRSLKMSPFDTYAYEFLLAFHSNYGAILYRLQHIRS